MNIALILSGGTGARMGLDVPKQYIEVEGKPVIAYCLQRFQESRRIDWIQIVADVAWQGVIAQCVNAGCAGSKFKGFSRPGENRQLSIWNGLSDIMKYAGDNDNVIIHDAARPLVSGEMIGDCLDALESHEGVLPALPVKDTVYYGVDGRIESLLDRGRVIAGQAPEAFKLGAYYNANKRLLPEEILQINGSTEPAVLAGMDVCYIAGDERNFKITTREDLERFRQVAGVVSEKV